MVSVLSQDIFRAELQAQSERQYRICLVFASTNGRISTSPSRAAVPGNRDVGGAVKRDRPGIRVFVFSVVVLILACLVMSRAANLAAQQSQTQSPADDPKQDEKKPQDNVKKDTPSQRLKP